MYLQSCKFSCVIVFSCVYAFNLTVAFGFKARPIYDSPINAYNDIFHHICTWAAKSSENQLVKSENENVIYYYSIRAVWDTSYDSPKVNIAPQQQNTGQGSDSVNTIENTKQDKLKKWEYLLKAVQRTGPNTYKKIYGYIHPLETYPYKLVDIKNRLGRGKKEIKLDKGIRPKSLTEEICNTAVATANEKEMFIRALRIKRSKLRKKWEWRMEFYKNES